MQDGAVIIQCNDIAVRQFVLRVAYCLAVGAMDLEFRLAGAKCRLGSVDDRNRVWASMLFRLAASGSATVIISEGDVAASNSANLSSRV